MNKHVEQSSGFDQIVLRAMYGSGQLAFKRSGNVREVFVRRNGNKKTKRPEDFIVEMFRGKKSFHVGGTHFYDRLIGSRIRLALTAGQKQGLLHRCDTLEGIAVGLMDVGMQHGCRRSFYNEISKYFTKANELWAFNGKDNSGLCTELTDSKSH